MNNEEELSPETQQQLQDVLTAVKNIRLGDVIFQAPSKQICQEIQKTLYGQLSRSLDGYSIVIDVTPRWDKFTRSQKIVWTIKKFFYTIMGIRYIDPKAELFVDMKAIPDQNSVINIGFDITAAGADLRKAS